jgi:Family of unknown function (DUF6178)
VPQVRKITRPSPQQVMRRLLDSPSLVTAVQSLAPHHLQKLIDHLGLEDSGEIVSLASTDQLQKIFDEDLWKSDRPGKDESFDAARLALWIEVMLETGEEFTARKLAALDEDLLTLLFHRRFLVLDTEELRLGLEEEEGSRSALVEKALDGSLHEEVGDYQIIARVHDGWDAMLSLLLALERQDDRLVRRILARCCALSAEDIEEKGGLYRVLTSEATLESDMAAERGERRAAQGFIAPSAAASFLKLCRQTPPDQVMAEPRDAVTRLYFRDRKPAGAAPASSTRTAGATTPEVARLEALIQSLDAPAPSPAANPRRALAGSAEVGDAPAQSLLERTLALLASRDAEAASRRVDELGYLANVLAAGCALGGRSFRPFEAALAAAATCNLGLERLTREEEDAAPLSAAVAADLLLRHGADKAFRIGFWLLHHDVVVATCRALERAFQREAAATVDDNLRPRLDRAAAAVHSSAASAAPWQARRHLDDIGIILDAPARQALRSLLAECPVLSGPLSGSAGARHRLDSEHQLIATADDLRRVRDFLARL